MGVQGGAYTAGTKIGHDRCHIESLGRATSHPGLRTLERGRETANQKMPRTLARAYTGRRVETTDAKSSRWGDAERLTPDIYGQWHRRHARRKGMNP
jgi:hypothetical protein